MNNNNLEVKKAITSNGNFEENTAESFFRFMAGMVSKYGQEIMEEQNNPNTKKGKKNMGYSKKDVERTKKYAKKFVRYAEGAEKYSMGMSKFQALAKEAKAVYKIDGIALVNCELFEKFLETFREF